MNETATVGQFVSDAMASAKRRTAKSRNAAGYTTMYSEIATALLAEYPNLTLPEKHAVFGTFSGEADSLLVRTGINSKAGLPGAARILGMRRDA
jgi:hypothetical protein